MKGTIKIDLVDTMTVEVHIHGRFSKIDRLCIMESLFRHLCRDDDERTAVCAIMAAGGVAKVFRGKAKEITLSPELEDFLKKKGYID